MNIWGRIWPTEGLNTTGSAPAVEAQTAESPSASGTGGEDIRLERHEDMDMIRAFAAVLMDEPDTARATVRDMSPKDRALLSFTLGGGVPPRVRGGAVPGDRGQAPGAAGHAARGLRGRLTGQDTAGDKGRDMFLALRHVPGV